MGGSPSRAVADHARSMTAPAPDATARGLTAWLGDRIRPEAVAASTHEARNYEHRS